MPIGGMNLAKKKNWKLMLALQKLTEVKFFRMKK
ncbi:hypothetical protein GALL_542290 [mine drainage metagenome]|jgi:hypothetical protein|uniref:Uncharacterized protein n=1 Tax=mine drainage metagenome TaxID=410659 RepID=A0A1J5PL14_9ZZZZ